jgi:hypothetical protein
MDAKEILELFTKNRREMKIIVEISEKIKKYT